MILLHLKRKSPFIEKRSYLFLFLQNIGLLFYMILCAANLSTGNTQYCQLLRWVVLSPFPFYVTAIIFRTWIYCFRYFLTKERSSFAKTSRWTSRLWLISPRFLLKLFIVAFLVQCCIIAIFNVLSVVQHDPVTEDRCVWHTNSIPVSWAFGAVTFCAFVVAVIFLWNSVDGYRIKDELKGIAVVSLIMVIFTMAQASSNGVISLELLYGMMLVCPFVFFSLSGFWLVWLSWRETKVDRPEMELVERLATRPQFRKQFFDFLCLQLCIENLLFWEDVQIYKTLPEGSAEQQTEANRMMEKYIKPGSYYEINLSSNTRKEVVGGVIAASSGTFAPAENEVLSTLKFHSYPLFVQSLKDTSSFSVSTYSASVSSEP